MKAFCFSHLFEKADFYLFQLETLWFQDPSRNLDPSLPFEQMAARLRTASILAFTQKDFSMWKAKLLCLADEIHPKVFIIGGTDIAFTNEDIEDLLETYPTACCFISNWLGSHPRCFLLPLGNKTYSEDQQHGLVPKQINLCITYCRPDSQDRLEFYSFLQQNPSLQTLCAPELPPSDYNQLLAQSLFSLCCCGNGYDTYRFWESLANGAIPIVKSNAFFESLRRQYPHLPFVSIDVWEDLFKLIPNLTETYWKSLWSSADTSCLWEPFWDSRLSAILNTP
jgi:hypothetical protein